MLLDIEAVVLHESGENIVGMTDLQMVDEVSGLRQVCTMGRCVLFFKREFRMVYAMCEIRDIYAESAGVLTVDIQAYLA